MMINFSIRWMRGALRLHALAYLGFHLGMFFIYVSTFVMRSLYAYYFLCRACYPDQARCLTVAEKSSAFHLTILLFQKIIS